MSAAPPPLEIDSVSKFKALVPRLKDLLAKLMEAAATVFYQNSANDNCSKAEVSTDRVDKCMEEFYAICDQMELLLKLALECNKHSSDSTKYTPLSVQVSAQKPPDGSTAGGRDPSQEPSVSFSQYLSTVRLQIRSAKEVHDLLLDCSNRLSDPASISLFPVPVAPQQQQSQQGQQQPAQQQQAVTTIPS